MREGNRGGAALQVGRAVDDRLETRAHIDRHPFDGKRWQIELLRHGFANTLAQLDGISGRLPLRVQK